MKNEPNFESEIRNRKLDECNLRFRISDLRCRNRSILKFPFIVLGSLFALTLFVQAQDSQRTIWDGVYNEAQAERGHAMFLDACSNCHGRNLEGADMTPPLTGGAFTSNWDGLTVGDLAD